MYWTSCDPNTVFGATFQIWSKGAPFHWIGLLADSVSKSQWPSVCACVWVCLYHCLRLLYLFLLLFSMVNIPIDHLKNDYLGNSYQIILVSEFTIFAQKWLKIAAQFFFGGKFAGLLLVHGCNASTIALKHREASTIELKRSRRSCSVKW